MCELASNAIRKIKSPEKWCTIGTCRFDSEFAEFCGRSPAMPRLAHTSVAAAEGALVLSSCAAFRAKIGCDSIVLPSGLLVRYEGATLD
jgi:hypothetical protein